MKSLLKIIRRFVFSAYFIVLLILIMDFAAYAALMIRSTDTSFNTRYRISEISDELTDTAQGLVMSPEGEAMMDASYVWGMLLNDDGTIIWSRNLPEAIAQKGRFTVPETASFSRWYLDDYPVYVWRHDQGLLVLAREQGSFWKLNLERPVSVLRMLPGYVLFVILSNLLLIFLLAVLAGRNLFRAIRPIMNGIRSLEEKEELSIPENGILSDLAASLNKTSALLARQARQLNRRDEARTEWISGVSHDIRTPLALIMGHAQELENNGALSDQAREEARIIKEQSLRIRQLIEDLNLTSKLEYQSYPLRIASFRPAALLRQIAADYLNQGLPESYEIQLNFSQEFMGLQLDGDEQLLTRAFRNLIGNSIRHNPNGCHITIAASVSAGEKTCCLLFADNGTGIPRRVIQVLEQQEGAEEGQKNQPHVMGLKIVKQIVEAHSGKMEILPPGQKGCRITVTLPL